MPAESTTTVTEFEIGAIEAINLPFKKSLFNKTQRVFLVVTAGAVKKTTKTVECKAQSVKWDEKFVQLKIDSSSYLELQVFEKHTMSSDILIGMVQVPYESLRSSPYQELNLTHSKFATPVSIKFISKCSSSITTAACHPSRGITDSGSKSLHTSDIPRSEPDPLDLAKDTIGNAEENLKSMQHSKVVSIIVSGSENVSKTMELVSSAREKWGTVFEKIDSVLRVVDSIAEVHPYAKTAWSILSFIPKILSDQLKLDVAIEDLFSAMHDAMDFAMDANDLREYCKGTQMTVLIQLISQITECGRFIQSYTEDTNFWVRLLKNTIKDKKGPIDKYCNALKTLREKFLGYVAVGTEVAVFRTLGEVESLGQMFQEHVLETDIRLLHYAEGASCSLDTDTGCLPKTRVKFLETITEWANNPDPTSARILLLLGVAGTGKSAIAREMAQRFFGVERLTTSFVFVRGKTTKREAYRLFPTLARDLSDHYPAFKIALGDAIKNNAAVMNNKDYSTLFESLLRNPLKKCRMIGPIVVVIDALDECEDLDADNRNEDIHSRSLHSFLADRLSELPPNFRFLITSRPEMDIRDAFNKCTSIRFMDIGDPELAGKVEDDIQLYMTSKLPPNIMSEFGDDLVQKSEGLFQWAAVACSYISRPPNGLTRRDCARRLLESSQRNVAQNNLDQLYRTVLCIQFPTIETDDEIRGHFSTVMGQILAAIEPLSAAFLVELQQYLPDSDNDDIEEKKGIVSGIIECMASLLSNVTTTNLPIAPLHTSFRDFLTNSIRSGAYYINLKDAHTQLAFSSLRIMEKLLRFNICDLETSYLPNEAIPDLACRVKEKIPHSLMYACRFWDDHLKYSVLDVDKPALLGMLSFFLEQNFLYWLEALSVMDEMAIATSALLMLRNWLAENSKAKRSDKIHGDLEELTVDALFFIRSFGMPMARSAPHIYLSALAFSPTSSSLYKIYADKFPNRLLFQNGQESRWPALFLTIPATDRTVRSVAFSLDGEHIVSGLDNGTAFIWNATTGQREGGPYGPNYGESEDIFPPYIDAVAFSPNGQSIATGSSDGAVYVWNVKTTEIVSGPWIGGTDAVSCVSFSTNGLQVASYTGDYIRLWDVKTGKELGSVQLDSSHEHLHSLVFMRDEPKITAHSKPGSSSIWNWKTGSLEMAVLSTLQSDVEDEKYMWSNAYISSAFSSDGQHFVRCTSTNTARVLNTLTREPLADLSIDSDSLILSLAFSSDAQHIVAASSKGKIYVWKVTGFVNEEFGLFYRGSDSRITTATISADGHFLASFSQCGTIRVWDITTGETVASPIEIDTTACAMMFSPTNNQLIAYTSLGGVTIWNFITEEIVTGPLTGGLAEDLFGPIAFSPNGKHLAFTRGDGPVHIWNADTGLVVATAASNFEGYSCLAFSQDGQFLGVGSSDEARVLVWDMVKSDWVGGGPFTIHDAVFWAIAFCEVANRRLITSIVGGSKGYVIDADTGEMVSGPVEFRGVTDPVSAVAFLPDGQHVAMTEYYGDNGIRIWNATTGEVVAGPFYGHPEPVVSIVFSADGRLMASASWNSPARIWSMSTILSSSSSALGSPESRIHSSNQQTVQQDHTADRDLLKAPFTDQSRLDEDGWIRGDNGELCFWVPIQHRPQLLRPSNVRILGSHQTLLDLDRFVHGKHWQGIRASS